MNLVKNPVKTILAVGAVLASSSFAVDPTTIAELTAVATGGLTGLQLVILALGGVAITIALAFAAIRVSKRGVGVV